MGGERNIFPLVWGLDTVIAVLEITNCMKQIYLRNSQKLISVKTNTFILTSNIPVSCSKQQFTDCHFEPQEHNSRHHNKNELLKKNVTEGESS
jgi:hypothetical protein